MCARSACVLKGRQYTCTYHHVCRDALNVFKLVLENTERRGVARTYYVYYVSATHALSKLRKIRTIYTLISTLLRKAETVEFLESKLNPVLASSALRLSLIVFACFASESQPRGEHISWPGIYCKQSMLDGLTLFRLQS